MVLVKDMKKAVLLNLFLLFLTYFFAGSVYGAEDKNEDYSITYKRVVVLHSYHKGQKWSDDLSRGIGDVLQNSNTELNYEYMDTTRFPDAAHLDRLASLYAYKYGNRRVDVVIPANQEALDFVLLNRKQMFPGAAIVYCGIIYYVDRFWEPRLTGVIEAIDLTGTVHIAKTLNPSLKEIFVIMDNTQTSISLINHFLQTIKEFAPGIRFRFSDFVSFAELLQQVKALQDDCAVFLVNYTNAADGRVLSSRESTGLISENSKVPVYSVWDSHMGYGVLGGKLVSGYTHGRKAAKMALRILQGEQVKNIPVLTDTPGQYIFDYNQLQKFNIKESDLPDKSTIENQPDPLYRRYKTMIMRFLGGAVALSFIIVLLSLNIVYRQRVEKSLKRYSDRLNFLHRLDQSVLNSFSLDEISDQIFRPTLHRVKCDLVGIQLFEQKGEPAWGMALKKVAIDNPISDFTFNPEKLPAALLEKKTAVTLDAKENTLCTALFPDLEFSQFDRYLLLPLVYKTGLLGIFFLAQENDRAINLNQKILSRQIADTLALAIQNHYLFMEIKKHEEKLRRMSSNIIEAQEQERKRLSAELHDEFGQSLTAININLSVIRKKLNISENSKIHARMQEAEKSIEALSDQVHNLSLDLRPPMLDDLGLVPTLRWFLKQYHERNGIKLTFTHENPDESEVPDQIAVTIYRVLQEALNNVSKHAEASVIEISLIISKSSITLKVADNGKGFDVNTYKFHKPGKGGLGLLGMRERLDLLNGHMKIRSGKNEGTIIEAVAPLKRSGE